MHFAFMFVDLLFFVLYFYLAHYVFQYEEFSLNNIYLKSMNQSRAT